MRSFAHYVILFASSKYFSAHNNNRKESRKSEAVAKKTNAVRLSSKLKAEARRMHLKFEQSWQRQLQRQHSGRGSAQ